MPRFRHCEAFDYPIKGKITKILKILKQNCTWGHYKPIFAKLSLVVPQCIHCTN